MAKIGLIVIDGQKDFCEGGKLAVNGGNAAMTKLANLIDRAGDKLDSIDLTLDAHHQHHIAHACMWQDKDGNHPGAYTTIRPGDCWEAVTPAWSWFQIQYLVDLEKRNDERIKLGLAPFYHTIWPDHCLIGTDGVSINNDLLKATFAWELKKKQPANKTIKGSFMFAEHFSVFKPEVRDKLQDFDQTNYKLIQRLEDLDVLAWAGLAKDYCVMNSFIDFITLASEGVKDAEELMKKMVFLDDGTAAVGAVPTLETSFDEYLSNGVTRTTIDNFLQ